MVVLQGSFANMSIFAVRGDFSPVEAVAVEAPRPIITVEANPPKKDKRKGVAITGLSRPTDEAEDDRAMAAVQKFVR